MRPSYFATVFDTDVSPRDLPDAWAVVTAHDPDGARRSFEENDAADAGLRSKLENAGARPWRVTGRSPSGDHAEPGWGVVMRLDDAKAFGREFFQESVFWIQHGEVRACDCAPAAMLLRVGPLAPRLNPAPVGTFPGRDRIAAHFQKKPDRLAATLRFLGAPEERAGNFSTFVADADESAFTLGDRLDAAASFQNRLEIAGRTSPFDRKNGYLRCCAEALLATPPSLRPAFLPAFDEMWVKYGYEG